MPLSERDFQNNVVELAGILGWHVAHFRPAPNRRGQWRTPMQGDPGFPDLVLARRGQVVFAELKSDKGKLSDQQVSWLLALSGDTELHYDERAMFYCQAGDKTVTLWRPDHLDLIQGILSGT